MVLCCCLSRQWLTSWMTLAIVYPVLIHPCYDLSKAVKLYVIYISSVNTRFSMVLTNMPIVVIGLMSLTLGIWWSLANLLKHMILPVAHSYGIRLRARNALIMLKMPYYSYWARIFSSLFMPTWGSPSVSLIIESGIKSQAAAFSVLIDRSALLTWSWLTGCMGPISCWVLYTVSAEYGC